MGRRTARAFGGSIQSSVGCACDASGSGERARHFHFAGDEDGGLAEFLDELGVFAGGDLAEAGFGDVGQCFVGAADVVFAEDVADADAEMLGVFEAVEDGVEIFGAAAELGQRAFEDGERGEVLDEEAIHQLVDHAGAAGEDAR